MGSCPDDTQEGSVDLREKWMVILIEILIDLENVPENQKGSRCGSDRQVVDLTHRTVIKMNELAAMRYIITTVETTQRTIQPFVLTK